MKSINDQESLRKAVMLISLIQQRRLIEKREDELKAYFKAIAGDERALEVGKVLITLTPSERTALDRGKLIEAFGESVIKLFDKITHFIKVEIKEL